MNEDGRRGLPAVVFAVVTMHGVVLCHVHNSSSSRVVVVVANAHRVVHIFSDDAG